MRLAASFLIMAAFFHDIDRSISQAGQPTASAPVIKVALLAHPIRTATSNCVARLVVIP